MPLWKILPQEKEDTGNNMSIKRKITKEIKIGDRAIGGSNPILVQSMTNTDTRDAEATIRQIKELEKAGCEIIRVAVPDEKAARALSEIKNNINIPLVADIHFDYKLALISVEAGVDKIRINPGNIKDPDKIKAVTDACKKVGLPIRIGVNIGSLEKEVESKYGRTAKAMVESALYNIKLLEESDFYDIAISLKASDVERTVEAYKMLSEKVNYPLHLGITEAGTPKAGIIKSSVGLGILLNEGIGDTIRVSLTGSPIEEVRVGFEILKSLKIRKKGVNFVSCPTCGRTEIDLIPLAEKVEKYLENVDKDITVAVMGCVVNGPGEAKEADIGIAGGKNAGVIFKKGEVLETLPEERLYERLIEEIEAI
jgi:(E)-4-hydroxy-3-methylbut-2-enyl-diphosphate synthase